MIVVDANVIAYCWISGSHSAIAQRVLVADSKWHAPALWQAELRNALFGYLRRGEKSLDEAIEIMDAAELAMAGREHTPATANVLAMATASNLSAYDAEYVVVARALGVPLVTEDRAIIKAFPGLAVSMADFLASRGESPPSAQQRARRYRTSAGGKRRTAAV